MLALPASDRSGGDKAPLRTAASPGSSPHPAPARGYRNTSNLVVDDSNHYGVLSINF